MLRILLMTVMLFVPLIAAEADAGRKRFGVFAVAGTDQIVADLDDDGAEVVTLDGSASLAPNGPVVSWSWADADGPLGTGETLAVSLPLGPRLVTLEVVDSLGGTSTDVVRIDVEPVACQAEVVDPLALYHIGHSLTDRMADLLSRTVDDWTGQVDDTPFAYKSIPGSPLFWHSDHPTDGLKGNIRLDEHGQPLNALQALQTHPFDALIMTESPLLESYVGDPVRETGIHANLWVDEFLAATTRPDPHVYLYSSWAQRNTLGPDTPETIATWLEAIEQRQPLWETVAQSIRDEPRPAHPDLPVYIVPGGLVLKRLQEQVLDGTLTLPGGLTFRETFFKQNRPGRGGGCATTDWIHLSQTGIYAVALTHYAVVYGTCPVGLPASIPFRGYKDGCIEADSVDVDPALAQHIQQVVWSVVKAYPPSGMPFTGNP